jgi:ABC-2 type transport system permease protein
VIPHGFGRDVGAGRPAKVQALFDGADANTAGVASGYLGAAVAAHNVQLFIDQAARRHGAHAASHAGGPFMGGAASPAEPVDLRWRVLYNPDLSSRNFIVPGLIVVLLATLAATLTSTTITRERELGSFESLVTSPVGAPELVIGKMVPYIVISAINVALVLVLSALLFDVRPRGSLLTLAGFTLLFLPGNLAIGMLISARAPTQQIALVYAMLIAFLPTLFLTGFAFPRSNMHPVVQWISSFLPATQYLTATRAVFLKGVGWRVLWPQAAWLAVTGTALVGLAIGTMRASIARGLE